MAHWPEARCWWEQVAWFVANKDFWLRKLLRNISPNVVSRADRMSKPAPEDSFLNAADKKTRFKNRSVSKNKQSWSGAEDPTSKAVVQSSLLHYGNNSKRGKWRSHKLRHFVIGWMNRQS